MTRSGRRVGVGQLFGRRMALTLPLPPQKNRSPPSELKPRHAGPRRHFEALEHLAGRGVNSANVARLALPGAVPELAIDPGDAGDEAIRLDGAEHGSGLGIDLMDPAGAVLADPERPVGPGEPRIPAVAGRRDRAEHLAGGRVDLLDHRLGDLEQVLAVEGRPRVARRRRARRRCPRSPGRGRSAGRRRRTRPVHRRR